MQQLRMKKLKNYYSLILFFLLVSTQVKAQSVDVIIGRGLHAALRP